MDYSFNPPTGFELGHRREFYEPLVENFYFTDAPWGSSFTGFTVVDDEQHNVNAGFTDGKATAVHFIGNPGDTFMGIPLDLPPAHIYQELIRDNPAWTIRTNDDDETFIRLNAQPDGIDVELVSDEHGIAAVCWIMANKSQKSEA